MNDREIAALAALQGSKKYGDICPDTVARVFQEELGKRKTIKEADKQTRARLHQITGAFLGAGELKAAEGLLDRYADGDAAALPDALKLHASTRERLPVMAALYERVFCVAGKPGMVLDLACGLNPLYLGSIGCRVRGIDIHIGANELVNRWASRCGWDVSASTLDLTMRPTLPEAGLALAQKLLPVLEQQRKGSALELLRAIPARHILVSFPTRTLSGRGVGMEQNYARWFEGLSFPHRMLDSFTLGSELCYLLEVNHG